MRLSLILSLLLRAVPLAAQTTSPTPPTAIDVLILPAVGDPVTTAPLGTRTTIVSATSPACNQIALASGPTPLINPSIAEIDDPFTPGRKCRLAMPVGLPNGTNYRAVVVATAICTSLPCASPRSLVGVPPFDLAPILGPPVVPTGVVVRP